MKKSKFSQVCRYKFDNFMSQGGSSILMLLLGTFLLTFTCIFVLRGIIHLFHFDVQWEGNLFKQGYIVFLQMTDPGNMAQDIGSSPFYKVPAIASGLAGIIMLSLLIGFITTGLVRQMDELRKGHSKVIEEGHTLILGWSEQRVVEILRELILANESEDDPVVVILSRTPKEEMDDFLKLALPDTLNTRVVTRSGETSSLPNLKVASVETCKSVIVLAYAGEDSPEEAKELSDAQVVKTILAIASCRPADVPLNIVAELFDNRNHSIVQSYCPHRITVANAVEILAKIIVQTSRSVGLSIAYSEILSFDGCEMYFHHDNWGGITFGEIQYHFPDGVPMGIRKADGEMLLNPPASMSLQPTDDILILAEDDSTIHFKKKPVAKPVDIPLKPGKLKQEIENELIIGWNRKVPILIHEYSDYVLDGSTIDIIIGQSDPEIEKEISQLNEDIDNLTIRLIVANPLSEKTLLNAQPSKRNNIIILGNCTEKSAEEIDAQTIMILLLLRRIFLEHSDETVNTRLITEVMDSSNQGLIANAGVKDFIISNRFISMLLAQISEEADIKIVYDNLFSEDGSEIYLKPACSYFETCPVEVSFADCMAIAQKREEVCLGIKILAQEPNPDENYGVKLIPEKNTRFTLTQGDCLIVLAEDET